MSDFKDYPNARLKARSTSASNPPPVLAAQNEKKGLATKKKRLKKSTLIKEDRKRHARSKTLFGINDVKPRKKQDPTFQTDTTSLNSSYSGKQNKKKVNFLLRNTVPEVTTESQSLDKISSANTVQLDETKPKKEDILDTSSGDLPLDQSISPTLDLNTNLECNVENDYKSIISKNETVISTNGNELQQPATENPNTTDKALVSDSEKAFPSKEAVSKTVTTIPKVEKSSREGDLELLVTALQDQIKELELSNRGLEAQTNYKSKRRSDGKSTITIKIKDITIRQKIAAGGSGASIYICSFHGWSCVMKELDLEAVQQGAVDAFQREIELLASLPYHPAICRYLFHEKKNNKLRLFLERCDISINDVLKQQRELFESAKGERFSKSTVVKWSYHIASGIAFLHKYKIVHRDIKPSNILAHNDQKQEISQLVIIDFDTAKRLNRKSHSKTVLGTIVYTAPEVLNAKKNSGYDFKCDVWSFGMVLYQLMTLKPPYWDRDRFEATELIEKGIRPTLDLLPQDWSELLQIFITCTELDPEKRPDAATVSAKLLALNKSCGSA